MKNIEISKGKISIKLLNNNLQYLVNKSNFKWIGQGRKPYIIFYREFFGKKVWIKKYFSSARNISHKIEGESIISSFTGWNVFGKKVSTTFIVEAKIIDEEKIDFKIIAQNETECYLKSVYFPQPFNAVACDKDNSYTVDPMRQGFMLPDSYKSNRMKILLMTKYTRKINTGDAYLPIWGRVCGENGYSAIIDNAYDCGLYSCYGKNKAFLTSSNFQSSLGKLDYERCVHYTFYDNCNYNIIAKDFRKHEIEKRNFINIDEKIKSNPKVANLIGTPIIHWRLLENNKPESRYYKKTKIGMRLQNTFEDSCKKFSYLKSLGLEKAYIHTDGWGNQGYDNLHPYILPPSEKIGGWSGMKMLSETCQKLGYSFGLHDQYRDFYHDSPVYDSTKNVISINGKAHYCDEWSGGAHNWLCGKFYKQFLEKTYTELNNKGVNIDGVYLDVFGIMWGDECFNKNHLLTRYDCIKLRGECFDYLRKKGIIVSSEEPGYQMVNYLDLVHHAPYAVSPQGGGKQVGIPIPLNNLVYGDTIFVPWVVDGRGGWGIPEKDSGKLHCLLNGQSPYFNAYMDNENKIKADDETIKARIKNVNEIAEFNNKVYNSEMVCHKFLDKNYRKQRTEFANGYAVEVDFDKDSYKIFVPKCIISETNK